MPVVLTSYSPSPSCALSSLLRCLLRFDASRSKAECAAVKPIEKTSLARHMVMWRKKFLEPMYADLASDFAARTKQREERMAVPLGNANVM